MKRVVCLFLVVLIAALALTSCQNRKVPETVETTPVILGNANRPSSAGGDPDDPGTPSAISNDQLVFTEYGNGYSVRKNPDVESYPACLVIPSTYNGKPVVRIDAYGFYDCEGVTEMVLPNSVRAIDYFGLPGGVHKLTCRSDIIFNDYKAYSMEELCLTAGSAGSSGCWVEMESLVRLTLGSGITVIEDTGFAGCWNLLEVDLPAGLTTIGVSAFAECGQIRSIALPEGLTSIGEAAFSNCMALRSIRLPDSLITLNEYAFVDCFSLDSVYIGKNLSNIGQHAFYGSPHVHGNFTVHPENAFFYQENGILFDKAGNELYEYLFH